MHAVIARFPMAEAHRETVLASLEESFAVTKTQPGCLACQLLAPSEEVDLRVCFMLWESKQAFQAFLQSDESKRAHESVRPECFSETPEVEQLEVLSSWRAPSKAAS